MAQPLYPALPNLNKLVDLYTEDQSGNRTWTVDPEGNRTWNARPAAVQTADIRGLTTVGSTEQVERERLVYAQFAKIYSEAHQGYTNDSSLLERIGLTPTTPLSVRKLFTAQYNATVKDKDRGNDQPIRMKTFMAATVLFCFTLVARIIRVVLRTVFFWLSMLVSAYKQSNYGPKMPADKKFNLVAEDLKRIGWEWIDLGATLATPFIGLINTLYAQAITLDWMSQKYLERTDEAMKKNEIEQEAKAAFNANEKLEQQAFEKRGRVNTAPTPAVVAVQA